MRESPTTAGARARGPGSRASGVVLDDGDAVASSETRRLLRRFERSSSILAVRSTSPSPDSDLTAAARIRNAALIRFARDGFDAGLRAIATDAGVTAGLITHHFGSKDGLRRACDAEVLRLTVEVKSASTYFGGPVDLMTQMSQVEEYIPATAYAMRSIVEGGELATELLDLFVKDSVAYTAAAVEAGTITPSHNEEARARYLLYSGFGALLLFARYEASDPGDVEAVTREFIDRYGPVTAELYSRPLFTDPGLYADYVRAASASSASSPAEAPAADSPAEAPAESLPAASPAEAAPRAPRPPRPDSSQEDS